MSSDSKVLDYFRDDFPGWFLQQDWPLESLKLIGVDAAQPDSDRVVFAFPTVERVTRPSFDALRMETAYTSCVVENVDSKRLDQLVQEAAAFVSQAINEMIFDALSDWVSEIEPRIVLDNRGHFQGLVRNDIPA